MTRFENNIIILVLILLGSTGRLGYAKVTDLGSFGTVYEINEKDAITELEDLSKGFSIQDFFDKEAVRKKILDFRPETIDLPKATENREFLVDLTYTLEFDIPDENGNIIYPKGYVFNPLEYSTLSKTYVFINGEDPDQIEWFKKSDYMDSIRVILMVTKGAYAELTENLDRPVFYALSQIIEKFQLEHVPSVVRQKGVYIHVEEVNCEEK